MLVVFPAPFTPTMSKIKGLASSVSGMDTGVRMSSKIVFNCSDKLAGSESCFLSMVSVSLFNLDQKCNKFSLNRNQGNRNIRKTTNY